MSRVLKSEHAWLIAVASSVFLLNARATQGEVPKPNIVILLSDDLGWKDIGCYDGPVRTPTLDRLAREGTRLTDFYSGAAVCRFLTGL